MATTNQSIVIDAPVADVWSRFSDFHDFSWAPNVMTQLGRIATGSEKAGR